MLVCGGCGGGSHHRRLATNSETGTVPVAGTGIHRIQHVVIVMQENRSFDSYFGTYPGADGIPIKNGRPTVCVAARAGCVRPYHDRYDQNLGGPHQVNNALADIDGGRMDGFVAQQRAALPSCNQAFNPACGGSSGANDVMGYHTGADIPNYWTYARDFVLQDHMFESVDSWSLPSHLFMVSGWSAKCTRQGRPMSCVNNDRAPAYPPDYATNVGGPPPDYAWTDLTYLLHKRQISWAYYVYKGDEPDCDNNAAMSCAPVAQGPKTPGIWNPLPYFDTVQQDAQVGDIRSLSSFFSAAQAGTLPAVSWITPNSQVSEHPPALVSKGQTYVTGLINAIMRSPDWNSTAIFLAWDDWGGFYDGVTPPVVDENGYGLRVPGLLISPYARSGYIDHQTLSFDAYLKFIEDDFLGGQRIDPKTDGRPDPRPDVREDQSQLGDLTSEFDFSQPPRKPVILPVDPVTDLIPPSGTGVRLPKPGGGVSGAALDFTGLSQYVIRAAADYLRLPRHQLRSELAAGQTTAQVAAAQGTTKAAVLAAVMAPIRAQLTGSGQIALGAGGTGPYVVRALAAYIGIAPKSLRTQLGSGKTLAQIASRSGRTVAQLRQAALAQLTAQVGQTLR